MYSVNEIAIQQYTTPYIFIIGYLFKGIKIFCISKYMKRDSVPKVSIDGISMNLYVICRNDLLSNFILYPIKAFMFCKEIFCYKFTLSL